MKVRRALFVAGVAGAIASLAFAFSSVTPCLGTEVDIAGGLLNPQFTGTPGKCPLFWLCDGSPAPGFASYAPGPLQYPGGHPFPTSAFSPTILAGSGTIRQLTPLMWAPAPTIYRLTLIAGLPVTEPGGATSVAGWPATNGAARLYFTFGSGFSQVTYWDIPSPPRGAFAPYPITFSLPASSPAVGQQIGVILFVSAQSNFSANFDIATSPCKVI